MKSPVYWMIVQALAIAAGIWAGIWLFDVIAH
jgi:hypothetical protein